MLATTGCLAESADSAAPVGAEEELKEQSLKLVTEGGLAVRDVPALTTGAEGTLACADRFTLDGRERLTCTRGKETLEVIVQTAEKRAVVIHRPQGRANDKRTFFVCTTSGKSGDLPGSLACSKKVPSTAGHGGLASPFASTVPGLDIPNAHTVGKGSNLLRGMAPHSEEDFAQLASTGVGAVLIFKNPTGLKDIPTEIATLEAHGIAASRIESIPFRWRDIGAFADPCKQAVEALSFIATSLAAKKKTFFHCTVGEDRTGLLSAMQRLLHEPSLTAERAWDEEMCERGYGSGNPLKPVFVTGALEDGLRPLYRKLSWLVAHGKLTAASLDPKVCASDPEADKTFAKTAPPLERFACGTSTRFEP
jgi:Tyrosine phosphatase family